MDNDKAQYLTANGLKTLQKECDDLKNIKIPEIANRIDEAKQLGDLSENAEYHQAKEDMAWAHGRLRELRYLLDNAVMVEGVKNTNGTVTVGSTVTARIRGLSKQYTIVGAQEAKPADGKISNESPLGQAFLGRRAGEKVDVQAPAGMQEYEIISIE